MTIGGQHEAKEFQSSLEHRRDLDLIEENRAIFWLLQSLVNKLDQGQLLLIYRSLQMMGDTYFVI